MDVRTRTRGWRHSLYARAFLFTVLGSGSLIGAVLVQSSVMIRSSVDQLLKDRIDLARSTGAFVEHIIRDDMHHLVETASVVLSERATFAAQKEKLCEAMSLVYPQTIFREGAFVLDSTGNFIDGYPQGLIDLKGRIDFLSLADRTRAVLGPVTSPIVKASTGARRVLVVLAPVIRGKDLVVAFVGGVLHPASARLFESLESIERRTFSTLQLIDANGFVVASTRPVELFTGSDHGSVLSQAIRDRREINGRCHVCHVSERSVQPVHPVQDERRTTDVLAFAPLPTLGLGMAVRQSESDALGPAFELQRRLILLGGSFVALFLIFSGLSVHSVVSPIKRLTRAVHEVEDANIKERLPSFGRDEVGQLSSALNRWRARVVDAMAEIEQHEEALNVEIDRTRRHLMALQNIADLSSKGKTLAEIAQHGLDQFLAFLEIKNGALALKHGEREYFGRAGAVSDDVAQGLLRPETWGAQKLASSAIGICRTGVVNTKIGSIERPMLLAQLSIAPDLFAAVMVSSEEELDVGAALRALSSIDARHVQSFLHQIVMSAANRIVYEQQLQQNQQSREFVHRLLTAQEEERRRIARELHDTIAQDLAAHRLQIERLSKQSADAGLQKRLADAETQAHEMLITLRQLLVDLRPSVLDTMGFLPALQSHLERVGRDSGIRGSLTVEGNERQLPREMTVLLFRIFQESLQNIVLHAKAEHVLATLNYVTDYLEMTIEDDGQGFDVKTIGAVRIDGHGLGLLGIMERVALMKGTVNIDSAPGTGTVVTVRVPWEA